MPFVSFDEPKGGIVDFDAPAPLEPEGGFTASAKSAVGAALKGAGQAAGDFIYGVDQDNALKRYGQEVIDANPTAVQSMGDIAEKPWTAVKEAAGNAGGSLGQMLGARALGTGITALSPLTGPAAPLTALVGQAISWFGPAAVAALPSYGGIRDKQILNDPANNDDAKSKAIAALGAATVGAIETKFGPQEWALSAMTKEGRTALAKKFAATTFGKSVAIAAGKGALIEGAEELVQNPVEQLASYDDPTTAESMQDTAFGGAMGAIGGGVLGGGHGGLFHQRKAVDTQPPPAIIDATTVDDAINAADAEVSAAISNVGQQWQALDTQSLTDLDLAQLEAEQAGARNARATDARIADLGQQWQALGIEDPATLLQRQRVGFETQETANVSQNADLPAVDSGAAGVGGIESGISLGNELGVGSVVEPTVDAGGEGALPTGGTAPLGAQQPAKLNTEPTSTWFGRRGDGYQTEADAAVALPTRQKVAPELQWKIEQMPSGRYRLAGYEAQQAVAPTFKATMNPTGTATIYGEPSAIKAQLAQAGIDKVVASADRVVVGVSQAQAAMQAIEQNQPLPPLSIPQPAIEGVANEQNTPPRTPGQAQPTQVEAGTPASGNAAGATAPLTDTGASSLEAAGVVDRPAAQVTQTTAPIGDVSGSQLGTGEMPGKSAALPTGGVDAFGVDMAPVASGGKPFKTKQEADTFRKANSNTLKTIRSNGGFVLVEKSEAEIARAAKAARRLSQPSFGSKGLPMNAMEFIVSRGGLGKSEMADSGFDRNYRVGNRWLFSAAGGMSIERATEQLQEEGYLPPSALHNDAYNLISRSQQTPQYTPEGWERIGEIENEARMQAAKDSQNEDMREFANAEKYLADHEIDTLDYAVESMPELFELGARLTAEQADAIFEEHDANNQPAIIEGNQNLEQDDAGRAPQSPGQGDSAQSRSQEGPRAAGQELLAAPSEADVLAQQGRRDNAEALDQREQVNREASGQTLTNPVAPEQRRDSTGDAFGGPTVEDAEKAIEAERKAKAKASDGPDLFGGLTDQEEGQKPEAKPVADMTPAELLRAAADKMDAKSNDATKIKDFGEKIGGAKKDIWTGFKDDLSAVADDEIAGRKLTEIWPAPDYQKLIDGGMDSKAVAVIRSLRDEIPSKPRNAYKLKRWAEQVKSMRDMASDILGNKETASAIVAQLERGTDKMRGLAGRVDLYEAVGHGKSLEGIRLAHHHYSLYRGRENVRLWVVDREAAATAFSNWPQELATGDTKEDAIAAFKARYSELDAIAAVKKASFDIYAQDGKVFIGKKIGRNIAEMAGPFESVKAAREYRANNLPTLDAKLAKYKEIPQERRDTNDPRVGEDMRNGQDVTAEMFGQAFGFRGVEFGNWVEQKRRQKDLNDAYDALMDMAAIMGVPAKAISLNGELGLAFGARGAGGINPAAAHYEADKIVINLTKREGAGSLGHEWWHAVDNYFSRMRGNRTSNFMTTATDVGLSSRGSNYVASPGVRKEMIDAFGAVVKAIKQTAIKARSSKLDAKRSKEYWVTGEEMAARAFESYLIAKLQDQNASNDYLANVVDQKTWDAMAALGMENDDSYPYPTAGEMPVIREGFDNFFDAIQTKETDKGVALFKRSEGIITPMAQTQAQAAVDAITAKWKSGPKVNVVNTYLDLPVKAPRDVKGMYYQGTAYVVASRHRSAQDVGRTLAHEVIAHHGLRNMLGRDDWMKLMKQVQFAIKAGNKPLNALRDTVRERYVNEDGSYTLSPNIESDEIIALGIESVIDENGEFKPGYGMFKAVWAKIATFLRDMGINIKFTNAELQGMLVLAQRELETGKKAEGGGEVLVAASRGEDARAARENDGAPERVDQTDTPEFKAWFKGSKVVDAEGRPLRVYHGTSKDTNFSKINVGPRGAWFTSDPEIASEYAEENDSKKLKIDRITGKYVDVNAASRVLPVFLKIENPYTLTQEDKFRVNVTNYAKGQRELFAEIKAKGYDGILWNNNLNKEWVVLGGPEQIKSAIGNNGQFDPNDPDIRFSRTGIVGQTNRQHTPEQLRAMKNVGFQVELPTLKERAQALWKDAGKTLAQGLADQFAPVKELGGDAYALLRLAKGASGAFEAFLQGGQLKLTDKVYDFDDAKKGGVVDRLLIPLQGEHHDFMRWIAANRAERLKTQGKENLFSAQDIADLKTLATGTTDFDYTIKTGPQAGQVTRDRMRIYADSQRVFNEFNKNILDLAEESGLIDGEARKLWEHEFYVPFYRVADESNMIAGANIKGGVVRQQAFKALKGGKNALNADLLDNTLMNWAHLLDAAAKNRAAKATLDTMENLGKAVNAPEHVVREMGTSVGNKDGVVWYMDDGMKRFFLVDDKHLLAAISSLEYAGMRNPVMNAMGAMKHALTVGVTASPFFKIRNLIRDSVQVLGTSEISANPFANVAKGWKLTDQKSDAYFRLLAGGGTIHFGTMYEGSEAKRVQSLVESGISAGSILDSDKKVKAFYRQFIEPAVTAYNELGNRGEAINRAALYDQLVKGGMGHAEASLQARDLMDFSMQGTFTSIRFLTQTVPFLNARIQGLYKLGRAAKEDPARFSAVIGSVAMVSLGLLAAYHDDDDWKKREEWDRNNFWWFKFGGQAFRIPKPFEIGAMATLAERGFELAFDKEMTNKRFMGQVRTLLGDNLSMNPIPQLVKPILDVYSNKDSFSGRPIETMSMERLQPEYRFNGRTTMAARAASTGMNAAARMLGGEALSPVQIDHMLRGYFGWLGSFIVGAGDVIARPMTDQPKQATPDYWKMATGSIVSDTRNAPSRYVSQMYEQAKEIEQAYGTYRALVKEGKMEEAKAFMEDNRDELKKHGVVAGVKRAQSKLNERRRMIERSNLQPEEKRELLQQISQQQDRIARVVAP